MLPVTLKRRRILRVVLPWQGSQDLGPAVEEVRAGSLSEQLGWEWGAVTQCNTATQGRWVSSCLSLSWRPDYMLC